MCRNYVLSPVSWLQPSCMVDLEVFPSILTFCKLSSIVCWLFFATECRWEPIEPSGRPIQVSHLGSKEDLTRSVAGQAVKSGGIHLLCWSSPVQVGRFVFGIILGSLEGSGGDIWYCIVLCPYCMCMWPPCPGPAGSYSHSPSISNVLCCFVRFWGHSVVWGQSVSRQGRTTNLESYETTYSHVRLVEHSWVGCWGQVVTLAKIVFWGCIVAVWGQRSHSAR